MSAVLTDRRRGITPRQIEIASYLKAEPKLGTTQLAKRLDVDPAAVWRIVLRLRMLGIVAYDNRRRCWKVTLPDDAPVSKLPD